MPVACYPEIVRLHIELFPRPAWEDRKLPVKTRESFRNEMALLLFLRLPGLRPSAVSVSYSTSAVSLVSQDAFAWDVLTNRQCLLDTSARIGSCRFNKMRIVFGQSSFYYV